MNNCDHRFRKKHKARYGYIYECADCEADVGEEMHQYILKLKTDVDKLWNELQETQERLEKKEAYIKQLREAVELDLMYGYEDDKYMLNLERLIDQEEIE
jgi:hypothetical protein